MTCALNECCTRQRFLGAMAAAVVVSVTCLAVLTQPALQARISSRFGRRDCQAEVTAQLKLARTMTTLWALASYERLPAEVSTALARLRQLNESSGSCGSAEARALVATVGESLEAAVGNNTFTSIAELQRCDHIDELQFGVVAPTVDNVFFRADMAIRHGFYRTEEADIFGMHVQARDFNPENASVRVAVVTACFGPPGSEHMQLCDAWWESWNRVATSQGVAVLRVLGPKEGMPDRTRAAQWQKVPLLRALLKADPPGGAYNLSIFVDADSIIRKVDMDIRQWAETRLGSKQVLLASDEWDGISTGEMFARRSTESIAFLEKWYRHAPEHYGRISLGPENSVFPDPVGPKQGAINLSVSNWWNGVGVNHPAFKGPVSWRNWALNEADRASFAPRPWFMSPLQRCSASSFSHEQGCLAYVMGAHPEMQKSLAVVGDLDMRNLFPNRGGPALFFHPCCRKTAERIKLVRQCASKLAETRSPC